MEVMLSQIDDKYHHFQRFSEITDHKYGKNATSISDRFIKWKSGNNITKKNTAEFKMQMEWKDGSTS